MLEMRWTCAVGLLGALGCGAGGASPGVLAGSGDAFPDRRPTLAAPGHLVGYVANRSSDSISVLDLDQMTVVGRAPVGLDPVDIDGPRHLTLDPAAGLAYVVVSYPQNVVGPHQAAAGATQRSSYLVALALADLAPLGNLRLDARAEELALSGDGGQLAVAHDDTLRAVQAGEVEQRRAVLDLVDGPAALAGGTPAARTVTVCVAPASVAYGAGGARAYVACSGEDVVAVVDTGAGAVLGRVPAGTANVNKPYAIVADAAGQRLLVSNQVARTAVMFSAGDAPSVLATFTVTGVPMFAAWISDDQVLVPEQSPSGVALISQASGAVLNEVFYADGDCLNPSDVHRSPDGRLFLVCEGDHQGPGAVVRLDPATLQVATRVPVGVYPDRLSLLAP